MAKRTPSGYGAQMGPTVHTATPPLGLGNPTGPWVLWLRVFGLQGQSAITNLLVHHRCPLSSFFFGFLKLALWP